MTLGDFVDPQTSITMHGVLHGTPTRGGIYDFTVQATDAANSVVSKAYTLNVTPTDQIFAGSFEF